jgi:hypothetical protein
MRRSLSVVSIALAVAAPRAAIAAEPPPNAPDAPEATAQSQEEALATELFTAARELISAGRYGEACPKLVESARLAQKVGTLGKLAECEEKLGQLVRARARWQQALNLARAQGDERAPIVERELARLDGIVPKLLVTFAGPPPAGLMVRVDGVDLGASGLGMALPLDPGRHSVAVTAPGKRTWSASIELTTDGKITLLSVPALKDAVEAQPAPLDTPKQEGGSGRSPLVAAGLVTAGVGVLALGAGAFLGVRAQTKLEESNEVGCNRDQCTPEGAEIRNEGRVAGDAATALFIAGGALAASGLVMWLVAPEPKAGSAPKVQALAGVGPSGGALSIRGRW